jgi:hypothetical protein
MLYSLNAGRQPVMNHGHTGRFWMLPLKYHQNLSAQAYDQIESLLYDSFEKNPGIDQPGLKPLPR